MGPPGITACVPHLQTFSVPGPPANFKHSAAALSTLAKAATLQPRPLTVSIGFRNCYVARFGNPRPSRVPYTLHVWSIALLGRFERSPPKLKVPNQKWTGLSTPIVKGHYTIELRLHMSHRSVTQVAIWHALSHAGNLMQVLICLAFCHQVERMRIFWLLSRLRLLSIESFGWWAHQNNSWWAHQTKKLQNCLLLRVFAYFCRFFVYLTFFCVRLVCGLMLRPD